MKNGESFKEYMSENHVLNRWGVLRIGIGGAFCGALLMSIIAVIAMIVM